jgi:hypothetical protein
MADEQHEEDHIALGGDEVYADGEQEQDQGDDVDYAAQYVDGEGEYDDAALEAAFEDDQVRAPPSIPAQPRSCRLRCCWCWGLTAPAPALAPPRRAGRSTTPAAASRTRASSRRAPR